MNKTYQTEYNRNVDRTQTGHIVRNITKGYLPFVTFSLFSSMFLVSGLLEPDKNLEVVIFENLFTIVFHLNG